MPTTSNFGWTTPADTDLVKDGAAAIRTLGNGIDTSLVDLKGGTTGQVLSKASNTDMDFTWTAGGDITSVAAGSGISGGGTSGDITITNAMATEITAAGDIIVGTGSATFDNLPIGTTGHVLTADTTVSPYKVKWAAVPSSTPSFSGVQLTSSGSGDQSISNNTWTKLTFGTESYDVGSYAASGDTITIPSGKGGYYLVIGRAFWDSNGTGLRNMAIYKNGTNVYQNNAVPSTQYPTSMVNAVFQVSATDTLELYVKQTSGGALNIYKSQSNDSGGSFSAALLGA